MNLHLQPHAAHAQRLAHVLLAVDDEFLRQDVQDLLIIGDRDRLGGLDDAIDVRLRHLLLLDRDHAAGVEAADVTSADGRVHLGDRAIRHQLSLLEDALDRRHRRFDVDHDAFLEPARRLRAQADDVEPLFGRHFGDDGDDFRRADVEADDQVLVVLHHVLDSYPALRGDLSVNPGTRTAKPLR